MRYLKKKNKMKSYFNECVPFVEHLQPKNILLTTTRTFIVELYMWRSHYDEMQQRERSDEGERPKIVAIVRQIGEKVGIGLAWHLGTVTLLRTMELALRIVLPESQANKFMKNVPNSAVRKTEKHNRLLSAFMIIKTSVVSEALTHLSLFLSEQAFRKPESIERTEYVKQGAIRHGASLVASSLGASVGTLLFPGTGTWIGSTVGELILNSSLQV